jgi:hypothetical protein
VEAADAVKARATAEVGDATEAAATVTIKEAVEGAAGAEVEVVAARKRPSSPSSLTATPRAKWSLVCDSRRDELLSTSSLTLTAAAAAASA